MRKSLRRVLERLRAATNGTLGKVAARPGLREPQRLLPVPASARSPLHG